MRLPEISIRNHRFTEVLVALLGALGLVSFLTMPRSEDPYFELTLANVVVVYPGADSEVVETLAVDPIEEVLREIPELRLLESTVEDGIAVIAAEMISGTSSDDAYDAVLQKVNEVMDDLPDEVQEVDVRQPSLTDVSILQLALLSDSDDLDQLRSVAEALEQELERAPGIERVDTWAYPDAEVRVELDPERMRALGVTVDQVARAIRSEEADIPGGFVTAGRRRLNVRTSGDLESLDAIASALLPGMGGALVRVQDVAEVLPAAEDEEHIARLMGERAVFVTLVQRERTNILEVLDGVRPLLEEAEANLPTGVRMATVFDQSESVEERVNGFFSSLLQGIGLVGLVMFLFLGFRPALLVMVTIPLAILLALGGVDFTGYGLQQMSIVGLVIALGLLVDDAIVVVESIGRFQRRGLSRIDAAIRGTSEVAWPSASGTATTVLAFLPMVAIGSGTGDYIRSLPVTVVYALAASLALSLTLTPLLASRFLRRQEGERSGGRGAVGETVAGAPRMEARRIGSLEDGAVGGAAADLEGPGAGPRGRASAPAQRPRGSGWLQARLEHLAETRYRRLLEASIRHPWRVMALGTLSIVAAFGLFPLVGVSLFPKAEKPQFLVNVETPDGTNLDRTDEVVRDVEAWLAARPEVVLHVGNAGADNPQVYYNVIPRQPRPSIGQVLVELDDYRSASTVVQDLLAHFDRYPGARISAVEFENGPPVEAPIVFKVTGPELDELERLATEVEMILRTTPGTQTVRNPLSVRKQDLQVAMDRDRLALLQLDPLTVDLTVRAAVAGLEVGSFRDATGESSDIVVRFPYAGRAPSPSDLDRVTLPSPAGGVIPLGQVATLELAPGTGRIDHYETERVATVTAYASEGASVLEITNAVSAQLDRVDFPRGYDWFAGGTFEEQQEGFAGMLRALLVAILGIFAILVLQFRSFVQPLIIFASVPLSFVGAVGALLLTGYTFSFTAFIGITSLVGIVINNSILLVDYANRRMEAGDDTEAALVQAGLVRFQPIVLTTLTTVSGLLPLTLTGSSLWSPLGWTIIGGLLTSTFLTLLLVPALYRLAARLAAPSPRPEPTPVPQGA